MPASSTTSRAERMRRQLREEIVHAAAEVFADRGYHRTAIADIAKRLGVGNSSIYAHFPGKRALFEEVVDDAIGRVLPLLAAENAPTAADTFEEYQEQVRRIAAGFATVLRDDPTILRVLRRLLLESGGVDEELAEKADAFTEAAAGMTAAYLRHGQERGYLRADLDTETTGRVVNGMIMSVALEETRREATPDETRRTIDATLALYFGGVAGPAS
ncbi:MAG: TetR/AcrR family transcriptional regulator [Solirubrobacteraceae bacterium]|nr:TetR/AcrR family transcriptional regulator [Solirubrobacteraceae bacterium]